ncbi:MAG: Gfo/Idh/MocA family oxidoreductase [Rhodothermia bacterium]|nr:MAG: Gfo/Idh/MocA family oxidoreductase [Rhodothermia bacterium]
MHRIAVVGLGAVTRNIHLPAYTLIRDRLDVVAGCDPNPDARAAAIKIFPQVYQDAEEMIKAESPDIVAVCTPPRFHRDHCLMALAYGCHVFCEKPMALNLAESNEIVSTSRNAGLHVVINSQFPYMRTYQAAKAMLGTPLFGDLQFMHAWQHFRRTEHTEEGWRGKMERRLCFEFGVHVFELARFFFDSNPSKIFAHMPNRFGEAPSDVVNTIALEFPDGRGAAIVLDRLSQGPHRYLELSLDGETGSIHTSIGGDLRFEMGIRTSDRRPFAAWHFVKGGQAVLHRDGRSRILAKEGLNPFATATSAHLAQFLDALHSGVEPRATAKDNRITLSLALAAYESAATGRVVDMEAFAAET